jgi:hypothetical protein
MYLHFTHPYNVDSILSDGIRNDREANGAQGIEWVLAFYDENPVYLTTEDSEFIGAYRDGPWPDYACFEVDPRGLPLVADLPSLVDKGARYEEGMLYVGRRGELAPLLAFADEDGWIEIEHLVDAGTDAARVAIEVTGTAACLARIPPDRLALRGRAPQP